MSTTFLYTDTVVIGVAGLVFGWEAALYAVVALFVSGLATDYTLEGPSVIRTAVIITDHPQQVADAIFRGLHRGVTSWPVTGMYTQQPHSILYVVVSRSEMRALRQVVSEADPESFIVIGQGHSAFGEGFKRPVRSPLDSVGPAAIRRQADEMGIPPMALIAHRRKGRFFAHEGDSPGEPVSSQSPASISMPRPGIRHPAA